MSVGDKFSDRQQSDVCLLESRNEFASTLAHAKQPKQLFYAKDALNNDFF